MGHIEKTYGKNDIPHVEEYARRLRKRFIPKVPKSQRSKLQEGKDPNVKRDIVIGIVIIIVCLPLLYYMVSWFCDHVVIYLK
jgi:hypothetical protein